ncbi:o-succinylbenzoate synthase [Altericista sp. CCNU0014]|uniref:o-succinylbenzoate synthase n=1 Tax=Altericista sp. CCNU0014 TaxID=3082949 RepID=UPI00384A5E3A
MTYRLRIEPYRWKFQQPIQTHHGLWEIREGSIVGLEREDGVVGWGEIAPIPWFGTETLEEAIAFCKSLPTFVTESDILSVPDRLPACQFGFGSAWEALSTPRPEADFAPSQIGVLLPAGEDALSAWPAPWAKGHRTFKWKIGVLDVPRELDLFHRLVSALPENAKLRLDANGGLTLAQAKQWLETCDRTSRIAIEYLEQPLPPDRFEAMMQLARAYKTPLALDESVATVAQLRQCYERGWKGVMAIKPAIAGYPQALRDFLNTHTADVVFSSAFETEIGRRAALALARSFNPPHRAIGFGVNPPRTDLSVYTQVSNTLR